MTRRTMPYGIEPERAERASAWASFDPSVRTLRLARADEMARRRVAANRYLAHITQHGEPSTLTERVELYADLS